VIDFLFSVCIVAVKLALFIGTAAGLFMLACFCLGWVIEKIKRLF